jgi:hypothetical protein
MTKVKATTKTTTFLPREKQKCERLWTLPRSVAEKRAIVQSTLEPGTSVAEVSRAHGVNANQVSAWRRAFERGELREASLALLPVTVSPAEDGADEMADEVRSDQAARGGLIHIELPGREWGWRMAHRRRLTAL